MPPGIVGTSFLFCVSARLSGPGSTSEIYGPGTLTDRRSLGIESETTRHRLRHPAGSALLVRGSSSANPTNSSLFRRVRDLLETTHRMQTAARRTSVQRDNFRDALLPLATAARVYRSRGGGRGGWNVPTAAGSMTREAALLLFNSVRANVSTIYRISFACTQGRIETE